MELDRSSYTVTCIIERIISTAALNCSRPNEMTQPCERDGFTLHKDA